MPAAASAFTSSPLWKCRASATWTSVAGNNRVEPVVANGNPSTSNNASPDRAQCATEEAGADNLATPIGVPTDILSAQSASAKTTITPELGRAIDQTVVALAKVEKLALPLGGGTVILGVGAATSEVTGSCENNQPKLVGTSSMADLTLGGTPISLNDLLAGLQQALEPLGVLVEVKFNEQVVAERSLTQRAAHIKLLGGQAMTPLADIVIAETKVDADQFTCDPNKQIPGFEGQICPTGSELDVTSGLCVIRLPGSGGGGGGGVGGVIVVGRPFQGPSGGTVIPLADARKLFGNHECLRGNTPGYAIVGTNARDRITGTNGRDRILSLGGNDSVDGGRGTDCVDVAAGNDRVTGGIGSDRIIGGAGNDTLTGNLDRDNITGGAGNDKLNGGPGRDRLDAGAGNDRINAGFNADTIIAGAGRDYVNIATAGPAAKANCGTGRDTIRMNRRERKLARSCETQYIFRDK